jgi:hypothetical protein
MQLPKRFDTHVTETASGKIFQEIFPDEWIIREVTERDYGIDYYLEICDNGFVTGKLLSIQLKGSENIRTNASGSSVTYYDVKPSTFNYWNQLPIPVIFLYIDTTTKNCFFCNVKKYIREHYIEFKKEELTSIKIQTTDILQKNTVVDILNQINLTEQDREKFEASVIDFLTSVEEKNNLLANHCYRDQFMSIEGEDELRIRKYVSDLQYLANSLNIPWTYRTLNKVIEDGQKKYGTDASLFEGEMTSYGKDLISIMKNIYSELKKLILNQEQNYWFKKNCLLYQYISGIDADDVIQDLH